MLIEIDPIDFDREKTVDSATTRNRINSVTPTAGAHTDSESGGPRPDRRGANEPRDACAIVQFLPGERRMRIALQRELVDRPSSVVLADGDGAVVRVEYYEGHEQLVCAGEARSAAPPGEDLPKRTERAPQTCDPAAIRAESGGTRSEIREPALQAIQDLDTPGALPSSSTRSLSGQPDGANVPVALLDRRVPQRGWEQEYGVPTYLIGAADVLYHHRKWVANTDAAVIDAAILRLFGPWIRRHAASSPIPQQVRS